MKLKELQIGDRFTTKDAQGHIYSGEFIGLDGKMAKVRFDHIGYADYRWTLVKKDIEVEKEKQNG